MTNKPLKLLILGANGFIGSNLTKRVLADTNWEIYALDMATDKLAESLDHERFHFIEGDITINKEWIAYHVKKCDVVLPLVAIATPITYVKDPLKVFKLDFEENLAIVRLCAKYKSRVLFPSTSEVYGMCTDKEFNPYTSNLVLGPIEKERWIYSCSKQLMDRVIYAYGNHEDLDFTLFRPFNWIGPNQDKVFENKEGSSRVVSEFLSNIVHGREIRLVDGGKQRRSFTYIDDGIDALMKIIENPKNAADGEIFNIGNPKNDYSIAELANMMVKIVKQHYPNYAKNLKVVNVKSEQYYGKNYQDVSARVPSIANIKKKLGWQPKTDMETALMKTLAFYLD